MSVFVGWPPRETVRAAIFADTAVRNSGVSVGGPCRGLLFALQLPSICEFVDLRIH